jgi:hypothetical protein
MIDWKIRARVWRALIIGGYGSAMFGIWHHEFTAGMWMFSMIALFIIATDKD